MKLTRRKPPSDEATRAKFEAAGYVCATHGSHLDPNISGPCAWRAGHTA